MTKINTKKFEDKVFKYKGVVGIGEGNKITKGVDTGKKAVMIFVKKKLPEKKLKNREIIPKKLGTYETDIIEVGEIKAEDPDRKSWMRPAKPGVSIGTPDVTAGTLGCIVYKDGYPHILTNNHVIGEFFKGAPSGKGKAVWQPGKLDGGKSTNTIALVEDYVEIDKYSCYVDCAIAKVLRPSLIDNDILGIGFVKGTKEVAVGDEVKKSGRTTGHTNGKIIAINVAVRIKYEKHMVICRDQIMATNMSTGGDSGSLGLTADNFAFGLLFAGSDKVTLFNKIQRVLTYLHCDFYAEGSLSKQFVNFIDSLDDPYWSIKEKKEYYELLYRLVEAENRVIENRTQKPEVEEKQSMWGNILKKVRELMGIKDEEQFNSEEDS